MLLNCGVGEDSWESFGLQGVPTSPSWRKSVLNINWKDWCWSWNSNTLVTWCEKITPWKRPWCWERLKAGGEGDKRGWDGWMVSLTQWTWVWVSSGRWWRTGKPGVLQSMGPRRVRHDWVTELNWILSSASSNLLLFSSSFLFHYHIFLALISSLYYVLFVEAFTVVFHSVPAFREYLYDHYFEFLIWCVAYLFLVYFFFWILAKLFFSIFLCLLILPNFLCSFLCVR